MQWQWASESGGPRLEPNSWQPIGGQRTPERPPDRATAVIRVQDEHIAALPEDDEALSLLWARIAAPQSAAG